MKHWEFENGIKVYEEDYDYDLHCFKVCNGDKYLGHIYPNTIDEMQEYTIAPLDAGIDPISGAWEDGCGNQCTLKGWGADAEI